MGLLLAITIIALWLLHLTWTLLFVPVSWTSGWTYIHIAVQGYLSTGLFITAHDAIHGTVVRGRRGNDVIGSLAAFLFAGLWYPRLVVNHHKHHDHPADDMLDPDFHVSNNLVVWFIAFMYRYTTIWQLITMGVAYNLLALRVEELRLWVWWIVPAFLGAFQLFLVGTYLPHRKPHTDNMPHHARSMPLNHVGAMLACYFFGYHAEHHLFPGTPWWQLWKVKERRIS
ncbi:MAG: fatty acid desaturase [Candidatus Kapabacteria bacterium]|nr:fatty acid desaturase [Candidatus Kapabacteria bacterium]